MKYQVCSRCVMDTTDPDVTFDHRGVCGYCNSMTRPLQKIKSQHYKGIDDLVYLGERIKSEAKGNYDCLVSLSGGADSSFAAHLVRYMGLNPLVVTLDNWWDTETAKQNVSRMTKGWDMEIQRVPWDLFCDLQRAFIKSGVIDIEMVTDNAILTFIGEKAKEHDIKYVISGSNIATEHCMPRAWLWNKTDLRNIKSIHKKFGEVKLELWKLPMIPTWRYLIERRTSYKVIKPLNMIWYRRREAIKTLQKRYGWEDYGAKHYESLFTKFYQGYILPTKFGIDKRKAHLSSLIRNGEITREDALYELRKPPYDPKELKQDKALVLENLKFTEKEFDNIMQQPPVPHDRFATDRSLVKIILGVYRVLKYFHVLHGRRVMTDDKMR